jgi:hypothetical protein
MTGELVRGAEGSLVRRLPGGTFSLRVPPPDSSLDEEVREFLENDVFKLLDVLGEGPLLYAHEGDVFNYILRHVVEPGSRQGFPLHPRDAVAVETDPYEHVLYCLVGGELYISPESFSLGIPAGIDIPLLFIRKSGNVEYSPMRYHYNDPWHTWVGPAKDRVLFESLKRVANQDPRIPLVRIDIEGGVPIMFYKPTHKLGEHAQRYLKQNPRLLETPR